MVNWSSVAAICMVALVVPSLLSVVPVGGAETTGNQTAPQQYIVTFEEESGRSNFTPPAGVTVTGGWSISFTPVLFVRASPDGLATLRRDSDVNSVVKNREVEEPEPRLQNETVGMQTAQIQSWGHREIGAGRAASKVDDSAEKKVNIAVIDSGVDYMHPEFSDIQWGADTIPSQTQYGILSAYESGSHGTMTAGVIGADDNGFGVVGVAPHAEMYPIQVFPKGKPAQTIDIIQAVDVGLKGPDKQLGTADDADVITFSGGGIGPPNQLERDVWTDASDYAVTVASAGNSGNDDPSTNEIGHPAKYPAVIAVAATDKTAQTTEFSSEGKQVELSAPGKRVVTTHPSGYDYYSGTSAAAPHVAGAAALIIAKDLEDNDRELSPQDVRYLLQLSASDIESPGRDRRSGYGLIQIDSVVFDNYVPIVLVSAPNAVRSGSTITLDGRETYDIDGTVSSGGWKQIRGPSGHLLEAAGTATFTAPTVQSNQTVEIVYTATDNEGASSQSSINITVMPPAPGAQYDVDGDGTVSEQDVQAVIQWYNNNGQINGNTVTAEMVMEAVSYYNS